MKDGVDGEKNQYAKSGREIMGHVFYVGFNFSVDLSFAFDRLCQTERLG
jgi:hypothetical protein